MRSTVRAIWLIYVICTLLGIALLWLGGVPLWQAINHCMTAITTGFQSASLTHWNPGTLFLMSLVMLAGATAWLLPASCLIWTRQLAC